MAARRRLILEAARRCFARRGFDATTMADLAREGGLSVGGIYTHFESKHAVVAALGSEMVAWAEAPPELDLLALFDRLMSEEGLLDAQLDLSLWSASQRDGELRSLLNEAFDRAKHALREALPREQRSAGRLALAEALVLGVEVQRALGRPQPKSMRAQLGQVMGGADG